MSNIIDAERTISELSNMVISFDRNAPILLQIKNSSNTNIFINRGDGVVRNIKTNEYIYWNEKLCIYETLEEKRCSEDQILYDLVIKEYCGG